jgi:predicted RNA-binding protein (virulence factor B family)
VLLIGSEIPEGAREGDEVRVFVYRDSEGRPIATTRVPRAERSEVAFLTVTALTVYGGFVDWGLAKELLVPFAEQTRPLAVGERHPIGVYLDDTGRLAGTMRVAEMLDVDPPPFAPGEWVMGEAFRSEPRIGLFAILGKRWVGLVPQTEPHSLSRGEAARFRVTRVHPDGKVELSLRGHAHEELDADAERILRKLSSPDAPRLGDHSDPERIREQFGLSKKAFKRAVGRLLKRGVVVLDREGCVVHRGR